MTPRTVEDVARARARAWVTSFSAQLDTALYRAGAYQADEPGAFVDDEIRGKRRTAVMEMVTAHLEGRDVVIPQWLGLIVASTVQAEMDRTLDREAGRTGLVSADED